MPLLNDVTIGAIDDSDKKMEALVQQTNEAFRKISNEDRTRIIKSDSGVETLTVGNLKDGGNGILIKDSASVNRALFGEYPDGSIALKLSQTGVDVTTATDDELIWSSDFNMFKIAASGSGTVPNPGGGANTNSNLAINTDIVSSTPLAMEAYMDGDDAIGYTKLPYTYPALDAAGAYGGIFWIYRCFTEVVGGKIRVNIHCNNYDPFGPGARVVKWYVFQETAS